MDLCRETDFGRMRQKRKFNDEIDPDCIIDVVPVQEMRRISE